MDEAKKSNVLIRKIVKYAVIIVTVYLTVTEIVPCVWKFNMYGTSKFDSTKWTETIDGKHGTVHRYLLNRCSMYNDLTKKHLKKGMKLKEVTDMLGDDGNDLLYYCTNKKAKCLTYTLGSCLNGALSKSLIVEYFGFYDRQFMYVCFDGNEEFISSGKSFGENEYPYLVCEGKDNTISCGKHSGDCRKAPRMGGEHNYEVIQDKVDFEQW